MVYQAAIFATIAVILKVIAAEPAGWILVPLAVAASIYHVIVHAGAARVAQPPTRLVGLSNGLLFAAIVLQIDFGWTYNCGHFAWSEITWKLGWSGRSCTFRGVPALIFDFALYIPVFITWRKLRNLR